MFRLRALVRAGASQDYIGVLVATVALVLIIGVVHPDFLDPRQLLDILNQATFVAILACGMAFLLAMRELDLSVGSIYGLTSLCAAMLMHAGVPSWLGVIAGLLIGALLAQSTDYSSNFSGFRRSSLPWQPCRSSAA